MQAKRAHNSKDYSGQIINNCQVLSFNKINPKNKKTSYKVKCSCGKIIIREISDLKRRKAYCRCSDNKNPQDICINSLYSRVKLNTKFRKVKVFNLTLDQFKSFIFKDCYYCGSKPNNTITVYKYQMKYNGIDRLINTIGYEFENCVPCCIKCNKSKSDLDFIDFKTWIGIVYNKLYKENK